MSIGKTGVDMLLFCKKRGDTHGDQGTTRENEHQTQQGRKVRT